MSNKSISMLQIRRLLQLSEQGVSKLQIATTLKVHRKTINDYLSKIQSSGKSIKDLLLLTDIELSKIVYQPKTEIVSERFKTLSVYFPYFTQELRKTGVTRQLLWQEYRLKHDHGYGYTQFCEYYSQYLIRNKATMHFEHIAGEYLQIDFAGKKLSYIEKETGQIIECPVLVCTLPASNYTYVEALPSSIGQYLFGAMNNCLEFLGGVPKNILSDNMKQYVIKNNRYEFNFQELAIQWSVHYNTNLDATRARHPKDKPSVENHVYQSYLRIFSKLRNSEFYSLTELNSAISELLKDFNNAPFQKLPGSRTERFIKEEKSVLKPLPAESFTVKFKTRAKVQMNYHVILGQDRHQYSVPYQYIGKETSIIYDQNNVEIFIGLERIGFHKRNMKPNSYTTLNEHMPAKHLEYRQTLGWDEDYFIQTGEKIGIYSGLVFKTILKSKPFPEQAYKACIGLKRLAQVYENERFERACERAMNGSYVNYGVIKNILKNNLDKKKEDNDLSKYQTPVHENIRGNESYK